MGVVWIIQTVGESGKVLIFVNATRPRIGKGNINYNIVSYHDPTPFQLVHVPQLQDSVRKWSFENSSVFFRETSYIKRRMWPFKPQEINLPFFWEKQVYMPRRAGIMLIIPRNCRLGLKTDELQEAEEFWKESPRFQTRLWRSSNSTARYGLSW